MSKTIKIQVIITLIFNSLILIGAGHGFGPVILFEILMFSKDFTKDCVNLIGTYDERLIPFSFFNLIIQIILLISIFAKFKAKKLINLSCILLIINLLYFTFDFTESSLSRFTILSGIPFLVCGIILLIKLNTEKK